MTTIPLKVAGTWTQKVAAAWKNAAHKAALSAAAKGVRDIQSVLIPGCVHPPVNRGTYKAAWKFESIPRGARIYNRQYPQAPLIEFGVRPENVKIGRKMIAALSEWIRMKGLPFRNPDDTLESVAWAIAKRMKEVGIFNQGKGFHFIQRAVPIMIREFERAFASYKIRP